MESTGSVVFEASSEDSPEELVVSIFEDNAVRELAGRDAWAWLLEHHPSLRDIHWIATKIGLTGEVSGVMMRGADMLRRFCWRCR